MTLDTIRISFQNEFTKEDLIERKVVKVKEIDSKLEWKERLDKIPNIQFPTSMDVEIINPFGGAVVRFVATDTYNNKDNNMVSIYLDCYDRLGLYGSPYWEVYPYDGYVYIDVILMKKIN